MRKTTLGFIVSTGILATVSGVAYSTDRVFLDCRGVVTGETIRDSYKRFDFEIRLSPPDFSGPGAMNWCMGFERDTIVSGCEINERQFYCTCKGGSVIYYSGLRLSRLTGELEIISLFKGDSNTKGDTWIGRYQCKTIQRRLF